MRNHAKAACTILIGAIVGVPGKGISVYSYRQVQDWLRIPESLARVTDASLPPRQIRIPEFILVQDVHRCTPVQIQIAELVERAYLFWGVRKVFLEGAFKPIDFTVFHRLTPQKRSRILDRLIRDGKLTGPELAAIRITEREWNNPPISPFQVFGADNLDYYRRNVEAYKDVLELREPALIELASIRRLQESMNLPEPNRLDDQLDRTEALLRLQLTPSEYEAYLADPENVPSTPVIDPAIHAAEEFYRLVQDRSQIFLNLALHKVPASAAPRLIVVGGFHTRSMADRLRRDGHTFVILTPAVGFDDDAPLYEQRLRQTAADLAQAGPLP